MFENVYRNISSACRAEIRNLCKSARPSVQEDEIESRLNHIIFIIRDTDSGTLAGVASAEEEKVPGLNNHYLYDLDWLIAQPHQGARQDNTLARMTIDFLESINQQADHKSIGVFSILKDEFLKENPDWRKVRWSELEMYLMGFTKSGNPIRVHYFKDARI